MAKKKPNHKYFKSSPQLPVKYGEVNDADLENELNEYFELERELKEVQDRLKPLIAERRELLLPKVRGFENASNKVGKLIFKFIESKMKVTPQYKEAFLESLEKVNKVTRNVLEMILKANTKEVLGKPSFGVNLITEEDPLAESIQDMWNTGKEFVYNMIDKISNIFSSSTEVLEDEADNMEDILENMNNELLQESFYGGDIFKEDLDILKETLEDEGYEYEIRNSYTDGSGEDFGVRVHYDPNHLRKYFTIGPRENGSYFINTTVDTSGNGTWYGDEEYTLEEVMNKLNNISKSILKENDFGYMAPLTESEEDLNFKVEFSDLLASGEDYDYEKYMMDFSTILNAYKNQEDSYDIMIDLEGYDNIVFGDDSYFEVTDILEKYIDKDTNQEFYILLDDITLIKDKVSLTESEDTTRGYDIYEHRNDSDLAKVIDDNYFKDDTIFYKGRELFNDLYIGGGNSLINTSYHNLNIGGSYEAEYEGVDEEGEVYFESEMIDIDGQESYMGYIPSLDIFVEGYDMFGDYGSKNLVYLKVNTNNIVEIYRDSDLYEGSGDMIYPHNYKGLHNAYPDIVDIRLD